MQLSNDPAVGLAMAPPPSLEELVPEPRPGYVWAPGYWDWVNERHFWVAGRWFPERRGYHWLRHHWIFRDGRWYLAAGGWIVDP